MIGVADTGYVVSVIFDTERFHNVCVRAHDKMELIFLPQSVLTESAFLITREAGDRVAAEWLRALPDSKYELIALDGQDIVSVPLDF